MRKPESGGPENSDNDRTTPSLPFASIIKDLGIILTKKDEKATSNDVLQQLINTPNKQSKVKFRLSPKANQAKKPSRPNLIRSAASIKILGDNLSIIIPKYIERNIGGNHSRAMRIPISEGETFNEVAAKIGIARSDISDPIWVISWPVESSVSDFLSLW